MNALRSCFVLVAVEQMNALYLVCDLSDQILKHLLWDSVVMLTGNGTEVDSDMGDFHV